MGITSCFINIGLMITPILMGNIKDNTPELDNGYYYITRLSLIIAILSFFVSVFIYVHDVKTTKILMMNVENRNLFLQ